MEPRRCGKCLHLVGKEAAHGGRQETARHLEMTVDCARVGKEAKAGEDDRYTWNGGKQGAEGDTCRCDRGFRWAILPSAHARPLQRCQWTAV
jgi:hypothetical protein